MENELSLCLAGFCEFEGEKCCSCVFDLGEALEYSFHVVFSCWKCWWIEVGSVCAGVLGGSGDRESMSFAKLELIVCR